MSHTGSPRLEQLLDEAEARLAGREPRSVERRSPRDHSDVPTEAALTTGQERLWFLEQIDREPATFIRPVALRLNGHLDIDILKTSLDQLIIRHDLLRAHYETRAGRPVMKIQPEASLSLAVLDADHVDGQMLRAALDDPAMHVDPDRAPMMAARLYKEDPEEHVLLLTFHHTIMDAWSAEVVRADLATIYSDLSRGEPVSLPPLDIQPTDLAEQQLRLIESGYFDAGVERIADRIRNHGDGLDFPPDRTRAAGRSRRGDTVSLRIDRDLVSALSELARSSGATLYMVLLSAYAILLSRWTGKTAFALASPTAGRGEPGAESVVGFLINRALIDIELSDDQPFIDFLANVREQTLDALLTADVPFELVLDKIAPAGEAHRPPLIQTTINLEIVPTKQAPDGPVTFESIGVPQHMAPFDLSVEAVSVDGGLDVSFIYSVELLSPGSVRNMAEQYQTLLRSIVAAPDVAVDQLSLLSDEQRDLILTKWSNGGRLEMEDLTIVEEFERMADTFPDATVVICRDETLTYRQLDRAANRLARHLRENGTAVGTRVAFKLERSVDLVTTMLAILKAGGVYVPLDLIHPEDRLRLLIEQTASSILVTTSPLVGGLGSVKLRVIELDTESAQIGSRNPDRPAADFDPGSLAYIVHTSGSTGRPKGVPCSHRAVVGFLHSASQFAPTGPGQRHLWISSPGFDMTNFQLWGALLFGGCCVVSWEERPTPSEIAKMIERFEVTHARMTASFFNLLIDEVPERLSSIEYWSTGGECMSVEHTRRAKMVLPDCRISNWYGPTETISSATEFELPDVPDARAVSIPIGRPQPGRTIYILDAGRKPVPPGIAGEICIGGSIVSEGYLDDPEATAASFPADPFSGEDGAVMYRTGDLGRWLPDGNIEYLGRTDRQVQIRGFRVEPGEVEAAIAQIPGVTDVAVVPVEFGKGGLSLAAFVHLRPETTISEDHCKSFLSERIPHHLVPSIWSFVDSLPTTASGKTDYARLARHAVDIVPAHEPSRPPQTETERRLAAIWKEVLGVEDVGVGNDFFQSGGHSLLAARLYVRIEREFGVEIPIATLFSAPTIESLSQLLDEEREKASWPSLVPIKKEGRTPAFFLVAQGNIVGFENVAQRLDDRAFYVFHHPAVHREPLLDLSIEEMAEHFLRELRKIQKNGPYLLGGWCAGSTVAFEMARRLRKEGDDVPLLAIMDSIRPPGVVGADGTVIHPTLDERSEQRPPLNRPSLPLRLFRRYVRLTRRLLMSQHRRKTRRIRAAMVGARSRYRPTMYDGAITLFQANPRTERVAQLQELWPLVTTGQFARRKLDCRHSELWKPFIADQTAAALSEEIERALASSSSSKKNA